MFYIKKRFIIGILVMTVVTLFQNCGGSKSSTSNSSFIGTDSNVSDSQAEVSVLSVIEVQLRELYLTHFEREPDGPGLEFWRGHVERGNVTIGQVRENFRGHAECVAQCLSMGTSMPPRGNHTIHAFYPLTAGSSVRTEFVKEGIQELSSHGVRSPCVVSHFSYDDPIVFPREPGRAHLHMFWGNTGTNAHTTAQSLATTGNGSCEGGIANRSAYWAPALFNASNEPVVPETIWIYYKSWMQNRNHLRPIPQGLQMLAHQNVLGANRAWHFKVSDHDRFTIEIRFPNCIETDSSGRPVLMSENNTSHLAYGSGVCPVSHPYMIPTMTIIINYDVDYNSQWQLASDSSPATRGQSLHADYIASWDTGIMEELVECVRVGRRNCGFLDNGRTNDRHFSPAGDRVYNSVHSLTSGFDRTPFGSSLTKMLTNHMGMGH